jgi:hypothetical protein
LSKIADPVGADFRRSMSIAEQNIRKGWKMPLITTGEPGHYDFKTDNVYFFMKNGNARVRCAVTLEALEKLNPKLKRGASTQVDCFNANRVRIEGVASTRFDMGYIESDGTVLIKAGDL